jgi:hypothetical protein
MPIWAYVILGLVALGLIPLVALAGRGVGKRARGNLALAAMLLGLGEPVDPPLKHLMEASHKDAESDEAAGDPPQPSG